MPTHTNIGAVRGSVVEEVMKAEAILVTLPAEGSNGGYNAKAYELASVCCAQRYQHWCARECAKLKLYGGGDIGGGDTPGGGGLNANAYELASAPA